jgi:hypothetical protein
VPVNGLKVFERVFTGPVLRFPKGRNRLLYDGHDGIDPLVEGKERPHPHG